jgi:hypothetical protein
MKTRSLADFEPWFSDFGAHGDRQKSACFFDLCNSAFIKNLSP